MSFEIKKAVSPAEIEQFILLPWSIYKNNPNWVPPLISERKKFLDPKINPFYEQAEVELFTAFSENSQPVGRIAVILNREHNKFHSESVGFFGLFESVNDQKVADLLFETAHDWCRSKGLDKMIGPMNLSTNHECGLLIEGFDTPPIVGMPYNASYYPSLFEHWGLKKAKDLLSFKLVPLKVKVPPSYVERAATRIMKRGRFSIRCLRLDRLKEDIEIIWEIYNSAWVRNWGFVPMTRKDFLFNALSMKNFIVPELCFIAEVQGKPAGFVLSLPDINQALKPMNGKVFPFGWLWFLLKKAKIKSYRTLTLGVKETYQGMGIDLVLYYKTLQGYVKYGATVCDQSWVLEDNEAMISILSRLGSEIYKRHRIYERACGD